MDNISKIILWIYFIVAIQRYDALNRRIVKKVEDVLSSKSFTRKYIYDGAEILAELDGSNNTLGIFTHSTLRTDDVLAVDVKSTDLATQTGSYFYLKDGLGSIIDIVDGSGTVVQHYAYSSFGKILKISDKNGVDVTANPIVKTSYGFTNREHDEESGMMYYRARYYMPEIGRFISEDIDPGDRKSPSTFNSKFVYALNSPVNRIDPFGKQSFHGGYCGPFAQPNVGGDNGKWVTTTSEVPGYWHEDGYWVPGQTITNEEWVHDRPRDRVDIHFH